MPPHREFRWTDHSDTGLAAVVAALEPAFTTTAGSLTPLRRTWLDTFDERLDRAGLVLEHRAGDGGTRLELTAADGRSWRVAAPEVTWPAFAADLPPGDLRDEVARVSDIRVLLVAGRSSSRQREIRVLNTDEKTVARLLVDIPSGRDSAGSSTLLSIKPVRGYEAAAVKIARAIAATPGIEATEPSSRRRDAVAAASPSTRNPAEDVVLTSDTPALDAVVLTLRRFRRTVEDNLPGLVDDLDTEFLHDFRVAVRRARSTVKLTGHVLPAGQAEALAAELKWLGDLTSPTRDLDVYLLGVPAMSQRLSSSPPEDLLPFQQHLARRRATEQRRLVRGVRSKRFRELSMMWEAVGASADGAHSDSGTAAELSRRSIGQAHRRVVKLGSRITPGSPAEDLHTLRKRCKELRYLLEIFAPLHEKAVHKQSLQVLKALQECLGDFQDSEVQADALRTFAVEMTSSGDAAPATLLSMGELAAALHAEQQRARNAFDGTFAAFMTAKNQRAFHALGAAPATSEDGRPPASGDTRSRSINNGKHKSVRRRERADLPGHDAAPGSLLELHAGGAT